MSAIFFGRVSTIWSVLIKWDLNHLFMNNSLISIIIDWRRPDIDICGEKGIRAVIFGILLT